MVQEVPPRLVIVSEFYMERLSHRCPRTGGARAYVDNLSIAWAFTVPTPSWLTKFSDQHFHNIQGTKK